MEDSKAFTLNVNDFKKIGVNGFLVGLAATLTYIGANLASVDLGTLGMVVIPIATILLNAAVSWAKNNHIVDNPTPPAPPA
jgi:hypothetical protein